MAKVFDFQSKYYGDVKGYLVKNKYADNNNLCIGVMGKEGSNNFFEPWCNLSVNIVSLASGEFAYDANNNQQSNNIINVLEREGVVINTGKTVRSGYCTYPIYKVTQKFHAWCRDR